MPESLAFDMYGTLVDPISVHRKLQETVGETAGQVAELWRAKQLEYTFRLTAMDSYLDFAVVTARSLEYTLMALGIQASDQQRQALVEEYQRLDPYPDTWPGLQKLADAGHQMVVFSNGTPAMLDELLDTTGLRQLLPEAVSVDEIGVYKPAPAVYRHLAERVGRPLDDVLLVSSNPFDVIGATAAGMQAAWCNRGAEVFDTLGQPPELVVETLEELATRTRHR